VIFGIQGEESGIQGVDSRLSREWNSESKDFLDYHTCGKSIHTLLFFFDTKAARLL
jgi:hypothetical protein